MVVLYQAGRIPFDLTVNNSLIVSMMMAGSSRLAKGEGVTGGGMGMVRRYGLNIVICHWRLADSRLTD